jgi:dephospho-CoA kinase
MARHAQPERLIVGITGRIGSGKTTVGKYLESRYGFQYLRYSAVLAQWRSKDPESKAQLQEIGWEVMAGGMQPELNRRLIAKVISGSDAAVDGLRHTIDQESLSQAFPSSFHLLYIESGAEQRWKHVKGKGRYTNRDVFNDADSQLVEQQIESLRANASLVVRNESSLQALYDAVDKAIREFRKVGQL